LFEGELSAGDHSFTWDAGDADRGIYVCLLRIGGSVSQVKLVKI
jgi:hypothetical protein